MAVIRNVSRKHIWHSNFLKQNTNKMVSTYGCSWWAKGGFYSCFPCSKHNRVCEFPTLIIWSPPKIGSCIFHLPENFEREKRPTFLFFSASCAWSHAALWATTERLSYFFLLPNESATQTSAPWGQPRAWLLLPSLCWGHEPHFSPAWGRQSLPRWCRSSAGCTLGPLGCTSQPCLWSCLQPPLLQVLTGAPGWSLALVHCFPSQGPLMDLVIGVVSDHGGTAPTGEGMACAGVTLRSQLIPLWEQLSVTKKQWKPALTIQAWKNDGNEPPSPCGISACKR